MDGPPEDYPKTKMRSGEEEFSVGVVWCYWFSCCCGFSWRSLSNFFPDMDLSEELETLLLLTMAVVLFDGALVLILSIASWL